jgi:fumarylpyruvate hydrolase
MMQGLSLYVQLAKGFTTTSASWLNHRQTYWWSSHYCSHVSSKAPLRIQHQSYSSCNRRSVEMTTATPIQPLFVPGIPIPNIPKIPVVMQDDNNVDQYYYPVNRIFCVGKNYVDHVKEMGGNPRNEAPCLFMKPSSAIVPCGREKSRSVDTTDTSAIKIMYPLKTNNLQYEIELVVALGNINDNGVSNVSIDNVSNMIYGYAIGVDLTRRDLQTIAKKNGLPWCTSKGFDQSAPISRIYPISLPHVYEKLHLPLLNRRMFNDTTNVDDVNNSETTKLWLQVNGTTQQTGYPISEMVWSISEIIVQLSQLYTLHSGDIIFTGTPAGVGTIVPNDHIHAGMNVLGELEFTIQSQSID